MKIVIIELEKGLSPAGMYSALFRAVGGPEGHGCSIDAVFDLMFWSDDCTTCKHPYAIHIRNSHSISLSAAAELSKLEAAINAEANKYLVSGDGEPPLTIVVEN